MDIKIEQISQRRFAAKADRKQRYLLQYAASIEFIKEIEQWCKENQIYIDIYRPAASHNFFIAVLNSDAQAFAFKMRWC